jgi:hypothetical protein
MVQQAQANRAEFLKTVVSAAASLGSFEAVAGDDLSINLFDL